MLAGCDRDSAAGRRDYAILLLSATLGLRVGEVSAIELDDINWRAGELVVRGKGNRIEVLPLPVDVGEALADYVRYGRPRCATRRLFVILHAPFTGLGPKGSVFAVVQRACRRAGVAATHQALISLLGLRVGEAIGLHRARSTPMPDC